MTCGIYCVTNALTGDRYIGQSRNIERRVKAHGVIPRNKHLTYAILQECDESDLDDLEWDWVSRLKPELNRTVPAADPVLGKVWRNPAVAASIRRRRPPGRLQSFYIRYELIAALRAVAAIENREISAQLRLWIREGADRWRLENPSRVEQLDRLVEGFLSDVESADRGDSKSA